ncbi:hypothetical protein TWF225_000088 [Orbilia oligospora]|nr:hypothetical protein TWF225_000088 [Orbilia oligospora]KAF3256061.1 hypothetical protein TWF128_005500 [Orbilia oligospora]KAF3261403.1 hypothetical protein TWF217_004547 [Orbilia oligospora]KAF3294235.1 hypothetical protein TWF132_003666 [Orbilia oligospora]
MLFSSLPPAILLLLSTSFAAAKPEDRTLSLFPAIPEVTEIAANSSLFAIIKATGAASTNYGINAKSQKPTETGTGTGTGTGTATATAIAAVSAGVDTNFYIDVTTFPNKNSQVLNYFTGAFPPTQVAEVTCSFEGTTSAVCQVTRLAKETGKAIAPGSLTSSEVTYAPAQMTFQPIVFQMASADSSASSLRIFGVPALVAYMVAAAIMLL